MTDTVAPPAPRAHGDEPVPESTRQDVHVRAWALVATLTALLTVVLVRVPWAAGDNYDDFNRRITLAPFDVVLLVILIRWCGTLRRRSWTRPTVLQGIGIALAASLVVAFAFHPSPLGVAWGLRMLAGWALVDTVVEAGTREGTSGRQRLLGGVVAVGVFQAVLGMAQSVNGARLGIDLLEFNGKLYTFGTSHAGRAGLDHPYHLACLLVVAVSAGLLGLRGATRRWPWIAALVVLGMGTATTYSRAAALGLGAMGLICVVAGLRRRECLLPVAAAAVGVGLLIGAVGFGDGWHAKAKQSTNAQQVDSARRERLEEARSLWESSPIVGIGPGRYVEVLSNRLHKSQLPAHDVVAQELAEGGLLAGILTGLLVVGLALWSWRRGAVTLAVFVTLIPFFLLDAYPYEFPTGIAISAIWLGLMVLGSRPVIPAKEGAA